jgi:hypothetical protein
MSQFNEVLQPIICDAYAEPSQHWVIERGMPLHRPPARAFANERARRGSAPCSVWASRQRA